MCTRRSLILGKIALFLENNYVAKNSGSEFKERDENIKTCENECVCVCLNTHIHVHKDTEWCFDIIIIS